MLSTVIFVARETLGIREFHHLKHVFSNWHVVQGDTSLDIPRAITAQHALGIKSTGHPAGTTEADIQARIPINRGRKKALHSLSFHDVLCSASSMTGLGFPTIVATWEITARSTGSNHPIEGIC